MGLVNNKQPVKGPIAASPGPGPTRSKILLARLGRFTLGSIFGIIFMAFCFVMLTAALKGPDTISGNRNGNSFGLVSIPSETRLKIGATAPDFLLEQLGGEPVQLSKLQGKTVLINFWASWCQPCEAEMPLLQQFYLKYKSENVVVLAINVRESAEVAKTYFKNHNLTMPVLLDTTGDVPGKGFRVTAYPESYFIDKNGLIGAFQIGPFENLQQLEEKLNESLQHARG